jgi:acyl-CoA thioesterase I
VKARALVAIAALVAAAACETAPAPPRPTAPPAEPPSPKLVYVAIGASETVGVGTTDPFSFAWPEVLYRSSFPPSAVFVDLGVPGATVATALRHEAPDARALHPSVVTMWLNVNDLFDGVTATTFEREIGRLLSLVRNHGTTQVLVANTPPLDRLPVYLGCRAEPRRCPLHRPVPPPVVLDRMVHAYNVAIARAASRTGSVLVDLHSAGERAIHDGTYSSLISGDGFHPDAAGYRLVAAAFEHALSELPGFG